MTSEGDEASLPFVSIVWHQWCTGIPVVIIIIIMQKTVIKLTNAMEKAPRDAQTLRAACSKVEPKIFTLPQTPFLGARDGQNLISWRRSLPLPTNPVWWGSMHAISNYHGNKHTHTQTDTGDYSTLRHRLARSVMTSYNSTVQCMVSTCQNETTSAWK